MDKRKLIQIIEKELEELKVLSEEITDNEDDTSLIIELALSKARLLCQEIELLREITAKNAAIPTDDSSEENEEDQIEEDEDEVSDVSISDPELEIVNFDESESEEILEPDEEDELQPILDEESEEDDFQEDEIDLEEDEEPELDEDEDDEDLMDDDDQDEIEEEYIEEEIEEEELIEFGENDNEEENEEAEAPQPESKIEYTELKADPQPGVREIQIDDMDDDDLEPIKISPVTNITERPVMREIPKPEAPTQEKVLIEEPSPKDRTLNDTIGETKSAEPPLTSGPITSLRAAIGLNDRFLFIREIFANNTDKYNSVIDQLDKLETQQQAVELLKANISLQKNETSMKFVDLLKRRFSK